MDLIQIYQCLCDRTRLRIVNLLDARSAVRMSFSANPGNPAGEGLPASCLPAQARDGETTRKGTWIIYSLPEKPTRELEANLKCLQDCTTSDKMFREDLTRLSKIQKCSDWKEYCGPKSCC